MIMFTMTAMDMNFYFLLVEVVCGQSELGVDIGWLSPKMVAAAKIDTCSSAYSWKLCATKWIGHSQENFK